MLETIQIQSKRRDSRSPPPSVLPIRIVVVSDALVERNGVGTYYQDLVQQVTDRVDRISLIAPAAGRRTDHERFSLPMPGDATQSLAYPNVGRLEQLILDQDPHVVVIPTMGPYAYHALRIARRHGLGVCVAQHTDVEALVAIYWKRPVAVVFRRLLQAINNWFIRRADLVATMNVDSLNDATRRGARCARQVGTMVPTSFIWTPHQPLKMDPPRVIFLGRLAAEKGIEQLLDAARELRRFQFCVGGDGPLRGRVVRHAARLPNLTFVGWLSRPEVSTMIDAADILVLPSRLESFGTVALEAMVRRRLVLLGPECGVTQWPELAHALFTIGEDEGLADALRRVAGLPRRRQESIASDGWVAANKFNEQTIHEWLEVFMNVKNTRSLASERREQRDEENAARARINTRCDA
jgi:glycosyltransferase involved in cell wall biosynthesis